MAETLRELINRIEFEVDDRLLLQADAAMDQLKINIMGADGAIAQLGTQIDTAAGQMIGASIDAGDHISALGTEASGAIDQLTGASGDGQSAIRDLGEGSRRAGQEIESSMRGATDSVSDLGGEASRALGLIQSGMQAIMATGFLRWIGGTAMDEEMAWSRLGFFVDKTTDNWDRLNDAIRDTVRFSRGIHREGELAEAAHQALRLGTSVDLVARHMQSAAVISAASGYDISQVMLQIGRAIETGSVRQLMEMGVVTEQTFATLGSEVKRSLMDWDRSRRELLVLTAVQEFASDKMGVYADHLDTAGARTLALRGAIGELAQTMGSPFLEPVARTADGLTTLLDTMRESPVGRWAIEFGAWAAVLGIGAIGFAGLAKVGGLALGVLKPMIPVMGKIGWKAALGVGIIEDLSTAFEGLPSVIELAWDSFAKFIGLDYTFAQFREDLPKVKEWATEIWAEWWDEYDGFMLDAVRRTFGIFRGLSGYVGGIAQAPFGLSKGLATGDWSLLEEAWGRIVSGNDDILRAFTLEPMRMREIGGGPISDDILERLRMGLPPQPTGAPYLPQAAARITPERAPAFALAGAGGVNIRVQTGDIRVEAPHADPIQVAAEVRRTLQAQLPDELDAQWRRLAAKRPRTTER